MSEQDKISALQQDLNTLTLYQPPEEVWKNIEHQMVLKKSKPPFGQYAIAASILISTIMITYRTDTIVNSATLAEQTLLLEQKLKNVPQSFLVVAEYRWLLHNNTHLLSTTTDEQQRVKLLEKRLTILNELLLQSNQTQQFI